MSDVSDKTKFAWPVVVAAVTLAAGVGITYAQVQAHAAILEKHDAKISDHESRITHAEDHYEAIRQWMENHK